MGTCGILPAPAWHANKDEVTVKRKKNEASTTALRREVSLAALCGFCLHMLDYSL